MNLGEAISAMYQGKKVIKKRKNSPTIKTILKFNDKQNHILYQLESGSWSRIDQNSLIMFGKEYVFEIDS